MEVAAGAVEAQFLRRWGSFFPKVFKHRVDEFVFFNDLGIYSYRSNTEGTGYSYYPSRMPRL